MSVRRFCLLLDAAKGGKNDRKWFPRWVRSYASSVHVSEMCQIGKRVRYEWHCQVLVGGRIELGVTGC